MGGRACPAAIEGGPPRFKQAAPHRAPSSHTPQHPPVRALGGVASPRTGGTLLPTRPAAASGRRCRGRHVMAAFPAAGWEAGPAEPLEPIAEAGEEGLLQAPSRAGDPTLSPSEDAVKVCARGGGQQGGRRGGNSGLVQGCGWLACSFFCSCNRLRAREPPSPTPLPPLPPPQVVVRVRPPLPRELQGFRPFQNAALVDAARTGITLSENPAATSAGGGGVENGVVSGTLCWFCALHGELRAAHHCAWWPGAACPVPTCLSLPCRGLPRHRCTARTVFRSMLSTAQRRRRRRCTRSQLAMLWPRCFRWGGSCQGLRAGLRSQVCARSARALLLDTPPACPSCSPPHPHPVQGYNAAIIAYGQTGTGKTYTMEVGSPLVAGGAVGASIVQARASAVASHTLWSSLLPHGVDGSLLCPPPPPPPPRPGSASGPGPRDHPPSDRGCVCCHPGGRCRRGARPLPRACVLPADLQRGARAECRRAPQRGRRGVACSEVQHAPNPAALRADHQRLAQARGWAAAGGA